MAADDRDGVLVDVYGSADAQLRAGLAALPGLPVALGEVGVVDVGLVHPGGVAKHDPVLVAGYRGEHAVPPLEGHLVGGAAQLSRALDGDVVAHEPDEGDPGGERLAAVLEDGTGEGGEPPAAAAAATPRDAGGGGAVPPGAAGAAPRAFRVDIAFGDLAAPNQHLLSKLSDLVIIKRQGCYETSPCFLGLHRHYRRRVYQARPICHVGLEAQDC